MRAPGAGRKPVPTAVKALRGTLQRCRVNPDEPEGTPGRPEPPEFLDERERGEWDRVADRLDSLGVLRLEHEDALFLVVVPKVQWLRACEKLRREGHVLTDAEGKRYPSPWLKERDASWAQYVRGCAESGLTPSSSTRVRAAPKKPAAESERDRMRREFGGAA